MPYLVAPAIPAGALAATGRPTHWALVDAESGGLLGRVAPKSFALTDGTAEIAYWTVPSARGRGLCPVADDRHGLPLFPDARAATASVG